MARYSEELMEQMVRKMMPPHNRSVASISRESGISAPTLYAWKRRFQEQGYVVPKRAGKPERWDGKARLAALIQTASMNEAEHLDLGGATIDEREPLPTQRILSEVLLHPCRESIEGTAHVGRHQTQPDARSTTNTQHAAPRRRRNTTPAPSSSSISHAQSIGRLSLLSAAGAVSSTNSASDCTPGASVARVTRSLRRHRSKVLLANP